MFPRTLFLGSSLNRGNPPPWPKPIPRGHKEKAKKSSSKHRPHRPQRLLRRQKTCKTGNYCAGDVRAILCHAVDKGRTAGDINESIHRKKYLQICAFHPLRSMRSVLCGVLLPSSLGVLLPPILEGLLSLLKGR